MGLLIAEDDPVSRRILEARLIRWGYNVVVTDNGRAGRRIIDMHNELLVAGKARENLISQLREAITSVRTLSDMLPICAACKKIRDDKGYWNQLEAGEAAGAVESGKAYQSKSPAGHPGGAF